MPPFVGVAVNVTLIPGQIVLPGFAVMLTDGVNVGPTDIIITGDATIFGLAQAREESIITITVSPLANVLVEYVLLFVPTSILFTLHRYIGVPPFVGVAVKVTLVPVQIVLPVFAVMLTDGVTIGVTFIVMPADVAVVVLTQVSEEVITTVITSPFANALFEYVLLFVPTLFPFRFH